MKNINNFGLSFFFLNKHLYLFFLLFFCVSSQLSNNLKNYMDNIITLQKII